MLSYWEKTSLLPYDFVLVGGGIVGLSAASALKEQAPKARVLVLERGLFPSGASTKNAGFACFGSPTELLSDLETMTEQEALALVERRWNGLLQLRARLGDEAIGLQAHGGYELLGPDRADALGELDRLNRLLRPIFGQEVYAPADADIEAFGFPRERVAHLVRNAFEAQIDTGRMMDALMAYASGRGVRVLTGCRVTSVEDDGQQAQVWVEGLEAPFVAPQAGICTNAFTQSLLGDRLPKPLQPGRGLVLATAPIPGLPLKGVFHLDEGYFYFRNHGERIIFGGGRHLDREAETTTEFGVNPKLHATLLELLRTVVAPYAPDVPVEHLWSGIMAFGDTKRPVQESVSPRVHLAVRLGGMGVAIGSDLGRWLAGRMLGLPA